MKCLTITGRVRLYSCFMNGPVWLTWLQESTTWVVDIACARSCTDIDKENEMSGYLGTLEYTGDAFVDAILSAVEQSGDGFHHTECWNDTLYDGKTCVENISEAAKSAAAELSTTKQKLEAAEQRIREMQNQEPSKPKQSDVDALLPCPFCGNKPRREVKNDILIIECPSCVSVGFHNHVRFGCRADEEWNKRSGLAAREEPKGWKLVPIELTVEMRVAAERERCKAPTNANPWHVWRAMLAAAPSPPKD